MCDDGLGVVRRGVLEAYSGVLASQVLSSHGGTGRTDSLGTARQWIRRGWHGRQRSIRE
jgi:hypothetical protein